MIGLCRANCLWATSFFRRYIIPAEANCQANRGINAVDLRKLTKYCDSFRFLELFCVYFYWDGTQMVCIDSVVEMCCDSVDCKHFRIGQSVECVFHIVPSILVL